MYVKIGNNTIKKYMKCNDTDGEIRNFTASEPECQEACDTDDDCYAYNIYRTDTLEQCYLFSKCFDLEAISNQWYAFVKEPYCQIISSFLQPIRYYSLISLHRMSIKLINLYWFKGSL